MAWDFSTEPEFESKLAWMREFVREEIMPLEVIGLDWREFRRAIVPLQQRVRDEGLWAAHLGPDLGGQGYGQVKLALMHEILGACELAPPVFGNQAPDSGNAELIAIGGSEEQKRRWLAPLLSGEMLSAFSMTELGTGSDPRQFTTTAVRDGSDWVINGAKWFVTNAERCDFQIVMVRTDPDPDADPYRAMSMLIVPAGTPGIELRRLGALNDDAGDGPVHNHSEVHYTDVRVPAENLLGGDGEAFVLAQRRLGPGRIHHCMRWVGVCRRAFDALCERAVSKSVHGGPLADKQTVQNWVADSAAAIEAFRLLTLRAAWTVDRDGAPAARTEIAMIKYWGAPIMYDVLDRAIQVHGSLGFSTDMPLEQMYRWARASRIYDGPDEVHRVTAARRILRGYEPRAVPTEHVPTRIERARETHGELFDAVTVA
ncbi:MAG TPA: acyl-CoA dehydrogenase family protein [Solirubrobacteraceae bacterium]|nr:acyl-CoA dehydrogenase family protein [Solirubrobacteraceae bacterium]